MKPSLRLTKKSSGVLTTKLICPISETAFMKDTAGPVHWSSGPSKCFRDLLKAPSHPAAWWLRPMLNVSLTNLEKSCL